MHLDCNELAVKVDAVETCGLYQPAEFGGSPLSIHLGMEIREKYF